MLTLLLVACHVPPSKPPGAPITKTPWGLLHLPALPDKGTFVFDVLPNGPLCGAEATYVRCASFTLPVVEEDTWMRLESLPIAITEPGKDELLAPQLLLFDEDWKQVDEVRPAGFSPVVSGNKGVARASVMLKPGGAARYALILSTRWKLDEPAWEGNRAPTWSNVGQVVVEIDP